MSRHYTAPEIEDLLQHRYDINDPRDILSEYSRKAESWFGATDEDIPDVIQESALKLHQHINAGGIVDKESLDAVGNANVIEISNVPIYWPRRYFTSIVKNKVFDRHRARHRKAGNHLSIDSVLEVASQSEQEMFDIYDQCSRTLEDLCHYCRALFEMKYLNGDSTRDISDRTGLPIRTIQRHLKACRERIMRR